MTTFIDCIKSINGEESVAARNYAVLYNACDSRKGIFGSAEHIEDIFKSFSDCPEFAFLFNTITGMKEQEPFQQGKWSEALCKYVAQELSEQNIAPQSELRFDGSERDLRALSQAVKTVFDFEDSLKDTVQYFFREQYDTEYIRITSSFLKVVSKFLHGFFPRSIIPFDINLYGKSKRLFHAEKCIVGNCVVPDEIKHALFDENMRVYNSFPEDLRVKATPDRARYLYFCAKIYALCEYLNENITGIEFNPVTLSILVCDSVVLKKQDLRKAERKYIFAYVENNSRKNKPNVFRAVSEDEKHYFERTFEGDLSEYNERSLDKEDDLPVVKVFAEFADFCTEECGIDTENITVVFADRPKSYFDKAVSAYLSLWQIRSVDIEGGYRVEMLYRENILPFKEFKKSCGIGLSEPYATKRLYEEYKRQYIQNGTCTEEELNRMESYVKTHLDVFHRHKTIVNGGEVLYRILAMCAMMCECDYKRFSALIDYIVDDYKRRKNGYKKTHLFLLLRDTAEMVFYEGKVDYQNIESGGRKPPLGRRLYKIYLNLNPENFQIVKEIIEGQKG